MAGPETNGAAAGPVVCVFCASSPGKNASHLSSARSLGKSLHAAGYTLVYGGGSMGIMGEVAKTFVSLSGPESVEGIIPRALIKTEKDPTTRGDSPSSSRNGSISPPSDTKTAEKTINASELQKIDSGSKNGVDPDAWVIPMSEFGRTTVVRDMHTRKQLMAQRVISGGAGSGFVALAGGYGTVEEVMEMVTWNQLGIHKMPIVLVNIDGYWDGLLGWVRKSIQEGFVGQGNANILVEVKDPADVPEALKNYKVAEGRFKLDWTKD